MKNLILRFLSVGAHHNQTINSTTRMSKGFLLYLHLKGNLIKVEKNFRTEEV